MKVNSPNFIILALSLCIHLACKTQGGDNTEEIEIVPESIGEGQQIGLMKQMDFESSEEYYRQATRSDIQERIEGVILPRYKKSLQSKFTEMGNQFRKLDLRYPRMNELANYFEPSFLDKISYAILDDLPNLDVLEGDTLSANLINKVHNMVLFDFSAITFDKKIFIRSLYSEHVPSFFHELVHAVQYDILGVDKFLLHYLHYHFDRELPGYTNNPLEKMAFDLEAEFDVPVEPGAKLTTFSVRARVLKELKTLGLIK